MKIFRLLQSTSSKWVLTLSIVFLAQLPAIAQAIENVRTSFDQSRQLMIITYDLKGLNYKKELQVIPYYTSGDTTPKPILSLTGDFGWMSVGGKNKMMVWDPFKDGITSLEGIQVKLRTEMRKAAVPKYLGVGLQGSNSAPLGVTLLQLKRVGFYVGLRTGKLPTSYNYKVNSVGEMGFSEPGVYEIGSERRIAGYAIATGPVIQMSRRTYAYVGVGYGVEQLYWKYRTFDLDKIQTGSAWALQEDVNRKGIVAETGAIVRVGRMIFELGLSSIQFKSLQITGGIGYAFLRN